MTLSECALAVPCQEWQLRELADNGRVPSVRAGTYRALAHRDLPAIRAACREAGYLLAKTERETPQPRSEKLSQR
jgi:hypothetical protein